MTRSDHGIRKPESAATWPCSCGAVAWQTYCQVCGKDKPAETPAAASSRRVSDQYAEDFMDAMQP